jgi:hypothetical protein
LRTLILRAMTALILTGWTSLAFADAEPTPGPLPDPSARLLAGDDASEYWTLYIELESGHRISQRFLLTNAGPGNHTAVAVGHLIEPGRAPYRYENGRRRSRWTLSEDRLFFDIAASHLDLHRPSGRLLITKDDIEIRLAFDFSRSDLSASVPRNRLPAGFAIDILAVAAPTSGSIQAPWMEAPLETTGKTWMAHTWSETAEAGLLDRRIDLYAADEHKALYGLQLRNGDAYSNHFYLGRDRSGRIVESPINVSERWLESSRASGEQDSSSYPLPGTFSITGPNTGQIALTREWLRFDPLNVIPNPFRWFIRRVTRPQEVWADAEFDVTLWSASGTPSNPPSDANESRNPDHSQDQSHPDSEPPTKRQAEREPEKGSATSSVTGVASITFMNPVDRR